MKPHRKIVVAMSGGVDSSVAAAMLVDEGHEVIGITIKTYRYEDVGGDEENKSSCCSLDGISDARQVASHLGIPHYVLDFSNRFGRDVIGNFVSEYLSGRTPNPCVVCNRKIKWEHLIAKASALGADSIATGHYARVCHDKESGRYFVARGEDKEKDQSYALWGLTQDSLRRTIFPLAGITKQDARTLGKRYGLPNMEKGESFEICFIPDNNYERFLKERLPELEAEVSDGEIIMGGEVVGHHRGFPFYTIGQRRGLGVFRPEPTYVTAIDPGTNRIEVGQESELYHSRLIARDVNLQKYADCAAGRRVHAMIRYKDRGEMAVIRDLPGDSVEVVFDEPRRAITPGQSVVFYEGDNLVGGGVIDRIADQR